MRIENLLLNNMNRNYSENLFKEGSIFKGEVLEILEEFILIDIKGQGTIKATSNMDIKSLIGEEISFLVKSNENGKMELKPLIQEDLSNVALGNKLGNPISKILNSFNIQETKMSLELVENLMKYNIPITEENVLEGIKILEKILELSSLSEDDKVILFEKKNTSENKLIKDSDSLDLKKHVNIEVGEIIKENENIKSVGKTNVKNLLIVDKDTYSEKEDISNIIKEFLASELKLDGEKLIKILGFFIKNEIKPSLSNIKNFKEMSENPIEFSKDFVKLTELLNELKGKGNFNKLKELPVNIKLNRENLEETRKDLRELQKPIEEFSLKSGISSNFKKEINELENKIDFFKEMDQDLSLLYIPINYGEKELDGVLNLLKENKNKKNMEDKLNIFINLDTNNLGNIRISCQAKSESLSIKINIQESDLKLFQFAEQALIDRIKSIGYIVDNIEFIIDRDIDIMDTIISNPDPTYFLDIKV